MPSEAAADLAALIARMTTVRAARAPGPTCRPHARLGRQGVVMAFTDVFVLLCVLNAAFAWLNGVEAPPRPGGGGRRRALKPQGVGQRI